MFVSYRVSYIVVRGRCFRVPLNTLWCRSYTSHLDPQRKHHDAGCLLKEFYMYWIIKKIVLYVTWSFMSSSQNSGLRHVSYQNTLSFTVFRMSCLNIIIIIIIIIVVAICKNHFFIYYHVTYDEFLKFLKLCTLHNKRFNLEELPGCW